MTDKEEYSTTKAWEGAENPETKYWRNMARYFRGQAKNFEKENERLREEKKDSYIKSVVLKGNSYIKSVLSKEKDNE